MFTRQKFSLMFTQMIWITLYKYRNLSWLIVLGFIAWAAYLYTQRPLAPAAETTKDIVLETRKIPEIESLPVDIFVPEKSSLDTQKLKETVNKRYRLAGTYQVFHEGDMQKQKAIVDDTQENRQRILAAGDSFGELSIVEIYEDYLEVTYEGEATQLHLSYSAAFSSNTAATEDTTEGSKKITKFIDLPALETNDLGKRVGENQWVMKRDALEGYYNEMLNDPERLANLYMSFRPDFNVDEKVAGYQLNMVGEKDFLNKMGLKENDVIRQVNSMNMTSQRRAEYFIGSFARKEMNAMVLDIERNGKKEKLIYMFR